ncbi:protein MMS22-like isoform X2 [Brachyhypopomus gauderio]|uniref:protein MMS22-like isoform X2 n=1 Tax=Brachyhypopomus gauderio TaxID=698409 RepID=UPI0040433E56
MEEDFSQSLTPPVSPFTVEELPVSSRPPHFSCVCDPGREESCRLSCEGYVGRGALKRLLLKLDPAPADFDADTVDIFGFPWVTETALVESTTLLFGLFRQKVFRLESLVHSSSQGFGQASSLHYEAEELRQQCTLFLTYVKVFIYRFLEATPALDEGPAHPFARLEAQLPSTLVEQLFSMTLLMGRLRDLPAHVQSTYTIQHPGKLLPPAWHLLHLHLDVHWAVLEILHLLGQKIMGETLTNISLFEDHLNNLLCDLVGLAMNKYSKVRASEALSTTHYHCVCSKELWVLIIHLLDHRSKTLHTQSFWAYVNTLLQSVLKGELARQELGLPAHCKDPLGFTWWLLTHIAQLGMFGRNGTLQNQKQMEDNWSFVSELLKSSWDVKAGLQEEHVRMHVHCCLSLSLMWTSNVGAVATLWEYFSKNLSGSFSVPWLGVSGLGSVSPSPLALLEQAKSCSSPAPLASTSHTQLYLSANSFLIFLRVLALHLKQEGAPGAPWRQIKGRIYAKFHARRMAELSESGLHHFLLLFLVLACCADLEDVAGRACDLLGLLPGATGPGVRALQWRGQLALTLLYGERGLDLAAPAARLAASFASAAREFYLKTTEPARRAALWPLLASYLEGVGEVWETSATLCLSEEKLLGEGFSLLLPACRAAELSTALGFLQTALAQLRRVQQLCHQRTCSADSSSCASPPSVAKERHLAVATALWSHFFPFLRSLRLSQTPPPQLADAGAGFTLLALDMPNSAPQDLQPRPVQAIMQCFGWDEMLCPLLVTRYLNHLLQNGDLVSWLGSGSGSSVAQALCVRAWIRCLLQQYLHKSPDAHNSRTGRTLDEQLAGMTRLVFGLPELESLLQTADLQVSSAKMEARPALALFIKSVGRVYSGLQLLSERTSLVCRALEYVGDILKYIKPYLLNRSTEGLQLTYWALGYMVKMWSPLLATAKALPLLLRIVDVLLLPHALLQQDKAPPTQLVSAIRDTLPLYLQGLSVSAGISQTQGAYLKQQLRNVITQYLSRFLPATPSAGAVANHPVLLAGCESVPSPRGAGLRRSILQVLRENFLQFKGHAPPPRLAAVLSFLLELLRRNNDTDPTLLTLPLPSVLRCLMLVNEPQVKRLSTDCLQLIVERCSSGQQEPCEHTLPILRSFVEENEGVYDLQVYTVLESVALLTPSTVVGLIPVLSQSLYNTEQKRGLGRNTSLRNGYRAVLVLLGEAGQAEMVSLDED